MNLRVLIWHSLYCLTLALSDIVTKKTNVTLGLIGIYCAIPGLKLNGSLITNYNITYDPKLIDYYGYGGFAFFGDLAATLAVEQINNSSKILKNVHVNIKQFSDCGGFYPAANTAFSGRPAGFAPSIMVEDLVEIHEDVIGVIGGEISSTACASAQELSSNQIPYCSFFLGSPRLDDRNIFNYFFRMFPSMRLGKPIALFLESLSVRQIGIVYQKDADSTLQIALDIVQTMQSKGIIVAVNVPLISKLTPAILDYAVTTFKQTTARYIIAIGSSDWLSNVVYTFGKRKMVGPNYVWITSNAPKPKSRDLMKVYGPDYYSFLTGLLVINSITASEYSETYYATLMSLNQMAGFNPLDSGIFSNFNTKLAYNCTMLMLLGFDKALAAASPSDPKLLAERRLQGIMNSSHFSNLGYQSLVYRLIQLTERGDMKTQYQFRAYNGTKYSISGAVHLGKIQALKERILGIGATDRELTSFEFYPDSQGFFFNGSLPLDGLPVQYSYTLEWQAGKIIVAMSCIGFLATFFSIIFLILFQSSAILRVASVPECLAIVLGCVSIQLHIYLHFGEAPAILICHLRNWAFNLGFNLVISTLICKNLLVTHTVGNYYYISCHYGEFLPRRVLLYYNVFLFLALLPTTYLVQLKVRWESHNESTILSITFFAIGLASLVISNFDTSSALFNLMKSICIWVAMMVVLLLLVGSRFGEMAQAGLLPTLHGPDSDPIRTPNRTRLSVRPNGTPNGLQLSSKCASNWIYSS
ncbi:periplasmic binding protein-like I [Obelidium mucronatum]|nr:periplasmic binding protein-like I [Obelidium mucronatum]